MLVKILALIFVFIWIRATLPRLRYDQLMALGWKVLLPLATLNVLVTRGPGVGDVSDRVPATCRRDERAWSRSSAAPSPGGRRRRLPRVRRDAARAEDDLRADHRGAGDDPVPGGEDAGLPALPRPPQAAPLRGHRPREVRRLLALRRGLPGRLHPRRRRRERPRRPRLGRRALRRGLRDQPRRCIFCGYCEVACPFDAITMGHEYEMADYNREDLIFTKEMLLAEPIERTPLRREGE